MIVYLVTLNTNSYLSNINLKLLVQFIKCSIILKNVQLWIVSSQLFNNKNYVKLKKYKAICQFYLIHHFFSVIYFEYNYNYLKYISSTFIEIITIFDLDVYIIKEKQCEKD